MKNLPLNIVILLIGVNFASTRYLSQITNHENDYKDKRIEHAGNINVDKEDYSKELEELSKSAHASDEGVVLDYTENKRDKNKMIIRQLMLIIHNYDKTQQDVGIGNEISKVGEILLKNTNEQLKVNKDMPEEQSLEFDDRKRMAEDNDSLSQVQIDKGSEHLTSKLQSNGENSRLGDRNIKSNGRSLDIKDTSQILLLDDNKYVSKNDIILIENENVHKESQSRDNHDIVKEELPNEVTEGMSYQFKAMKVRPEDKNYSYELPQEKNDSFNDTNGQNTTKGNGHRHMYQTKQNVLYENPLSYNESYGNYQSENANDRNNDKIEQSNNVVHEGQSGDDEGTFCTPVCTEDEVYELDESQHRDGINRFSEKRNQERVQVDQSSNIMFPRKDHLNQEKTSRNSQEETDQVNGKSNVSLYRPNNNKNMYPGRTYKKQGLKNFPFVKNKYWIM